MVMGLGLALRWLLIGKRRARAHFSPGVMVLQSSLLPRSVAMLRMLLVWLIAEVEKKGIGLKRGHLKGRRRRC